MCYLNFVHKKRTLKQQLPVRNRDLGVVIYSVTKTKLSSFKKLIKLSSNEQPHQATMVLDILIENKRNATSFTSKCISETCLEKLEKPSRLTSKDRAAASLFLTQKLDMNHRWVSVTLYTISSAQALLLLFTINTCCCLQRQDSG